VQSLGGLEEPGLVVGGDKVEARQLLHGLGVGPVGDQRGAVRAAANDAGTPGTRELGAAGDPTATLLEQAAQLVVGVVDGLVVGFGALVPLGLIVGGEQDDVIGHDASSRCGISHWGDGWVEVSSTFVPEPSRARFRARGRRGCGGGRLPLAARRRGRTRSGTRRMASAMI